MDDRVISIKEQELPSNYPSEGDRDNYTNSETSPEAQAADSRNASTQIQDSESREPSLEDEQESWQESNTDSEKSSWLGGWRGIIAGLFLGIIGTLGAMYWVSRQNPRPQPEAKVVSQSVESKSAVTQSVTVAPVVVGAVVQTLEATGTVASYDLLPVLPQTNGLQIKQVLVKEGDVVEKGQVMAVLDDSVLRSQIAEAIAKVESADATTQQAEVQVLQAQSGQKEATAGIDQAKAQVLQAQADAVEAQAEIEKAKAGIGQAEAGVAQARAELEQAAREVARSQQLASEGAIAQQDLEKRKTEIKTAQANVNKALEELNKSIEEVKVAQAQFINAQANIKTAQAVVSSAQAKFDSSVSNIYSAKANVGNNQANVRSTVARVEQLRKQLEQTLVKAPESGIVAEQIVRIGDVTNGSQKLFTIIRNGRLELQVKVPETQLPQVRVGTETRVTSDTDPRIALRGIVREIAPTVDPQNRQATVKIDLPPIQEIRESPLRPGMFLRAAIATGNAKGLKIPATALLPQADGKAIVYRLMGEDKVQAQSVEVGEISGASGKDLTNAQVEVKNGLNPGDRVVVSGTESLKDGDRVKVVSDNGVTPNSQ